MTVRTYDVRSDTLEFEHRFPLPPATLAKNADDIERWAVKERLYERNEVLRRLAQSAAEDDYTKAGS